MTLAVDAHLHVFDRADRSPRAVNALTPLEREALPRTILDHMHDVGIDRAVLVALDEHDDAVRDAMAEYPGRFASVIVSGPREQGRSSADPGNALETRRKQLPVDGVRTMWLGEPGRPLADSPAIPMLRYLVEHGLPLWSYLPPDQAAFLPEVAATFPDLVVVVNHFGFAPHGMTVDQHGRPSFTDPFPPDDVERARSLAQFPSFRLLFSGQYVLAREPYPYRDFAVVSRLLVREFGAERTMWGSDWPWIDEVPGYAQTRALVDIVFDDRTADEREAIGGGTAAALFGFTAELPSPSSLLDREQN